MYSEVDNCSNPYPGGINMKSWRVVLLTVLVFVSAKALEFDDYDDGTSADHSNTTHPQTDEYSEIAAQLNCSSLTTHHKGSKTDENATGSIYKQPLNPVTLVASSPNAATHDNQTVNSGDISPMKSRLKRSSRHGRRKSNRNHHNSTSEPPDISSPMPDNQTSLNSSADVTSDLECDYAFDDDGPLYNWYQVIVENGGAPGKVNATRLNPKSTDIVNPCHRPINSTTTSSDDLLYDYELMHFEKVYRREKAFLRFARLPSKFTDIVGQLVWAPPHTQQRYYRLFYRKDDTGLYINVRQRQKCMFRKTPPSVHCEHVHDFSPCENSFASSFPPSLQAALIG